jgi:hypothetical protein
VNLLVPFEFVGRDEPLQANVAGVRPEIGVHLSVPLELVSLVIHQRYRHMTGFTDPWIYSSRAKIERTYRYESLRANRANELPDSHVDFLKDKKRKKRKTGGRWTITDCCGDECTKRVVHLVQVQLVSSDKALETRFAHVRPGWTVDPLKRRCEVRDQSSQNKYSNSFQLTPRSREEKKGAPSVQGNRSEQS